MSRLFLTREIKKSELEQVPVRLLAHLGDAVFHLFERERIILSAANARQMHSDTAGRVSASKQAKLLDKLMPSLTLSELDLVRRARNVKTSNYRRGEQLAYRKATALEALLGYLYLTDEGRLMQLLSLALIEPESG